MKKQKRKGRALTEAIFYEIVEGVLVACVRELVVVGRELLEALGSDGTEVPCELRELGDHNRTTRHETVDQRRLLPRH